MVFSIEVVFPDRSKGYSETPVLDGRVSVDRPCNLVIKDSKGVPTLGARIFFQETAGWIWGVVRLTNGLIDPTDNISSAVGIVSLETLNIKFNDKVFHTEKKVYMRPRGVLEIPFSIKYDEATEALCPLTSCLTKSRINTKKLYGPTNQYQPSVDADSQNKVLSGAISGIEQAKTRPSYIYSDEASNLSYQFKKLGPFTVEGYPNGYAHGGYGIDPNHGYEGVSLMIKYHFEMAMANMHRQFCDAINIKTFKPVSLYEWKPPVGRDLMKGQEGRQNEIELLPFLIGDYNTYRYKIHSKFSVEPEYVKELWEYRPNDLAHIIRIVRHLIPLIEYLPRGNPIRECALFDLSMISEDCRYQAWSDRKDELATPSYPGQWVPQTLTRMMVEPATKGHPRLERNAGWMAYLGACMIKYGVSRNWTNWGLNMLEVFEKYLDEYSFPHRDSHPTAFPQGGRGTQIFHMGIVGIGSSALSIQINNRLPEWVENMACVMYDQITPLKDPYGGTTYGPAHWWQTEQNGVTINPPSFSEHGDPAHVLALMAVIIQHTRQRNGTLLGYGLRHFYQKSLQFYIPSKTFKDRLELFRTMPNKSWIAHMEAIIERFG